MLRLNNSNLRAALMLGAATASALGLAGAAKADTVETVVVTGSRIPQIGLTATSPVTALGQKDIKLDGANSIGNLLSTLPSVVNDGDGQSVNNGSVGVATIDLRNLGTKRTLVLVDGKRLVAADASLNVDTNQIPATMIDRIEVLTGGASAVYGSDAVAGVVNIILKKDFQGIEADSQASLTDHGDGLIHDSSLILGVSSDNGKGNVTIYGEFMHRDAISEADRDFSAHALGASPRRWLARQREQRRFSRPAAGSPLLTAVASTSRRSNNCRRKASAIPSAQRATTRLMSRSISTRASPFPTIRSERKSGPHR
jgi:outer membrane cobalamin receptor